MGISHYKLYVLRSTFYVAFVQRADTYKQTPDAVLRYIRTQRLDPYNVLRKTYNSNESH